MLGAYLIYATGFAMPAGTSNKGDLLLPATSVKTLNITDRKGQTIDFLNGQKKWRMLIVGDNQCTKVCQDQLYVSRQVYTRLGEKSVRLERLFLNIDADYAAKLASTLEKEHPKLTMAHVEASRWRALLRDTSVANHGLKAAHVYYVDQEGFLMMSYDGHHVGADLLDDIKRLLKFSYDG